MSFPLDEISVEVKNLQELNAIIDVAHEKGYYWIRDLMGPVIPVTKEGKGYIRLKEQLEKGKLFLIFNQGFRQFSFSESPWCKPIAYTEAIKTIKEYK